MSITVPTAQERAGPTSPRPPPRHGIVRGVAVVAAVVVAVLAWGDADAPRSPATAVATEPVLSESTPAEPPADELPGDWTETYFPGSGAVTGVATSIHGMAAVGQRQLPGGDAFVWTRVPGSDEWVSASLEGGASAVVRDVVAYVDGFVVVGAIVEPGSGTSVPTLWFGTAGSAFTVRDRPFAGPGRIDRVEVMGGELILIGQAAGPFSDNLEPGAARFGRLLSGIPGTWTDVTPSGPSVVVSDVVEFEDGLLAAGADSRGPLVWWRAQAAEAWSATRVTPDERAVVVDVVSRPDGGFAALVRTWADRNTPRSTVFQADHPRAWTPMGLPLRRALGWIEAADDGVVGGPYDSVGRTEDSPVLWRLDPSEGWTYSKVAEEREIVGATELRGAHEDMVYGSTAGQPVVWHNQGTDVGTVVRPDSRDEWARIGALPAGTLDVIDIGRHIVAFSRSPDPFRLWISREGTDWQSVGVDTDFVLGGVGDTESGAVVWGQVGSGGVIYDVHPDDGSRWATRTFPDTTIRHVSDSRYGRRILAESPSGPVRIVVGDRGDQTVTAVPALPTAIVDHAGVLIGFDHIRPIRSLSLSADRGDSWRSIDISGFTVATSEAGLLVVSGDRRLWAVDLDTFEVHEVDVPDAITFDSTPALGAHPPGWAGGLPVDGPALMTVDVELIALVTPVPTTLESGMSGVFSRSVPGPRAYAVVAEGGQSVLYRWNGGAR